MKLRLTQEKASFDEELDAMVSMSSFPLVGPHISLPDPYHMALSYSDISCFTLDNCYVASKVLRWFLILHIRTLQLSS